MVKWVFKDVQQHLWLDLVDICALEALMRMESEYTTEVCWGNMPSIPWGACTVTPVTPSHTVMAWRHLRSLHIFCKNMHSPVAVSKQALSALLQCRTDLSPTTIDCFSVVECSYECKNPSVPCRDTSLSTIVLLRIESSTQACRAGAGANLSK